MRPFICLALLACVATVMAAQRPAARGLEITAPPAGAGAPPPPAHNGTAYWIKVNAREDGSFTITNARNGFTKTYTATSR